MHNAPSVSYPVGRCAFQRRVWGACLIASSVLLGLWGLQQGIGLIEGVALVMLLAAAVLGWREGMQAAGGSEGAHLQWDGQAWHWRLDVCDHARAGEVQVVLDAQDTLFLRWRPLSDTLSGPQWFWLSRDRQPADWLHLRRAVYGPR